MKIPLAEDLTKPICKDCHKQFELPLKLINHPLFSRYCKPCAKKRFAKGVRTREAARKKRENSLIIELDFSNHMALRNELILWAKREFRDPANQILHLIYQAIDREKPYSPKAWIEGSPSQYSEMTYSTEEKAL